MVDQHFVVLSLLAIAGCSAARPHSDALAVTSTVSPSAEVTAIRAERSASNAAIARRDAAGTVASMMPSYYALPAGGAGAMPRDSTFAVLSRQFADTGMLGYVRTPTSIEVSATGPTAAEYGRWVGRRRRADGIQETSGPYFAAWRKTPDGWRLQMETFVALSCAGSAQCPVAR